MPPWVPPPDQTTLRRSRTARLVGPSPRGTRSPGYSVPSSFSTARRPARRARSAETDSSARLAASRLRAVASRVRAYASERRRVIASTVRCTAAPTPSRCPAGTRSGKAKPRSSSTQSPATHVSSAAPHPAAPRTPSGSATATRRANTHTPRVPSIPPVTQTTPSTVASAIPTARWAAGPVPSRRRAA
ncbi:MAG TPA: hypothetical protein VHG51_18555 [Longimicrobiaceae bacterium]|nr:hypothetical protein [Longimicrobiaceae bacterium]